MKHVYNGKSLRDPASLKTGNAVPGRKWGRSYRGKKTE